MSRREDDSNFAFGTIHMSNVANVLLDVEMETESIDELVMGRKFVFAFFK